MKADKISLLTMIRKAIPHLFTLSNLFCGVLGIIMAFNTQLVWASYLIGIAAILDFFDGFAARMLNVPSELGKQLDSLADMVTFGVLPGIILFQFISISFGEYFVSISERPLNHVLIACIALLIPVFSGLRLAIFNIDEKQTDTFLGVPTPANAIMIASIPVILEYQYDLNMYYPMSDAVLASVTNLHYWSLFDFYTVLFFFDTRTYVTVAIVMSVLLVARIPMLSFKFKSFDWKTNKARYGYIILVLLAVVAVFLPYWFRIRGFPYLDFVIIPIIILLYIVYSMVLNIINFKVRSKAEHKND